MYKQHITKALSYNVYYKGILASFSFMKRALDKHAFTQSDPMLRHQLYLSPHQWSLNVLWGSLGPATMIAVTIQIISFSTPYLQLRGEKLSPKLDTVTAHQNF